MYTLQASPKECLEGDTMAKLHGQTYLQCLIANTMRCAVMQLSTHDNADNHLALHNGMPYKQSFQDGVSTAAHKRQNAVSLVPSHTDSVTDSVTDSLTDSVNDSVTDSGTDTATDSGTVSVTCKTAVPDSVFV